MLEDIKATYERCADLQAPGWRTLNKNELFRTYSNYEGNKIKQEGYFAAIVVKYWGKLYKFKQISPGFTSLDFYDWYIRGIRIILKLQPWTDPDSPLYNDPSGPDKAVNRALKTSRLTSYEKSNTYKRKANINSYSIEALEETYKDGVTPQHLQIEGVKEEDLPHLIMREAFAKKDYFTAFMIFNIIARDPFEVVENETGKHLQYSEKKLARYMHNIDDRMCKVFAKELNIDVEEARFAAKTCTELSMFRIKSAIRRNLKILSNSEYFNERD